MVTQQHIAVIGSGIAGLASAWLLSERYRVTLVEKSSYIGGHTNTVDVAQANNNNLPVDTGFIVYNEPNYPNLVGLFDVLGVESRETTMSFGVSIDNGAMEYAGSNLSTLFAQRSNLLRPRFLRMTRDIVHFNHAAKQLLVQDTSQQTLEEFLRQQGYGAGLRDDYLLPMAAAIWSCPPEKMGAFPVRSFARFFNNHGLLDLKDRPVWRTVKGGSRTYVTRMLETFSGEVIHHNPAVSVRREPGTTTVTLKDGTRISCDQVVMATHADDALALLESPTQAERELLGKFCYQPNETFLHTDRTLMPRRKQVWSSWNYLANRAQSSDRAVSVTYWMNRLQGLETDTDYLVSLNPLRLPDQEKTIKRMTYMHPVFDMPAMTAQQQLYTLQGQHNTWFAGSYFGYGFHEDALRSAVEVARSLGVAPPWGEQEPLQPPLMSAA